MGGLFDGLLGTRLRQSIFVAVILVCVFLAVTVVAQLQGLRYIGAGVQASNTISVSGHGEIDLAPDLATITFSVVSIKSTVAAAQEEATIKANAIVAYLKGAGIADKDIQTSNYTIFPQYDYVQQACVNGFCPGGKQVLRGYEARQSTTIKIHDISKAGDVLSGVGEKGATEVSGINFTFDDPNKPQNEARNEAIADAKSKADVLAKQLGVSIVRVVAFNESSSGYPTPYAYGRAGVTANQAMDSKAIAPEISPGQNKITNDVTVTYEIR